MTPEQIQKMADGFPPSSIGKDHEEVVTWLAQQHAHLQEQVRDSTERAERLHGMFNAALDKQGELQEQVKTLADDNSAKGQCLAFFASVIKSGESWSSTCQREYDAAQLRAKPEGEQP